MIKIQYLTPSDIDGGNSRDEFMKTLSLELFNFNVLILICLIGFRLT